MSVLSYIHNRIRTTPWLGRVALNTIPDIRWQINVDPIGKMIIRLRQNRMYWLRRPLTHEGFMLGSLKRLIRKGDVVYDIGANIGLYSRFIVQQFRASHVYAFEPMANNCSLLADNLRIGGCTTKVTVLSCALGDQDGTARFQIDDITYNTGTLDAVTHGNASASRRQYGLPPTTVEVAVSRLDTLLDTQNILKPNVIKLDVEGAEAMVVMGARNSLLQHRPRLAIELHNAEAAKSTLKALWDIDYYCFGYLRVNGVSKYTRLTPSSLESIIDRTGPMSPLTLPNLVASADEADVLQPIENLVM